MSTETERDEETPQARVTRARKTLATRSKNKKNREVATNDDAGKELCVVCREHKPEYYTTPSHGAGRPRKVYCADCVEDMIGVMSMHFIMVLKNEQKNSARYQN